MILEKKSLTKELMLKALGLWNSHYPVELILKDLQAFKNYLTDLSEKRHFLKIDSEENLCAWMMTFKRDGKVQLAIIVNSAYQNSGIGSALLAEAKKNHTELYGWVINTSDYKLTSGENYLSPISFYKKNGFEILDETTLENAPIRALRIRWEKS